METSGNVGKNCTIHVERGSGQVWASKETKPRRRGRQRIVVYRWPTCYGQDDGVVIIDRDVCVFTAVTFAFGRGVS